MRLTPDMTKPQRDALIKHLPMKEQMEHLVLLLAVIQGSKAVIWDNMSMKQCKHWESRAVEMEYFEAAYMYKENIYRCYDYKIEPIKDKITHTFN